MTADIDWNQLAEQAIAKQVGVWAVNMKLACESVNSNEKFQSKEFPWLRQLTWLNFVLSGSALVPRLSGPATVLSFVVGALSEAFKREFNKEVKLASEYLEQNHNGVLGSYMTLIDGYERKFFKMEATKRFAESMKYMLVDLVTSKELGPRFIAACYDSRGNLSHETAISLLRDVIDDSDVLPSAKPRLERDYVEPVFAGIYNNLQELFASSFKARFMRRDIGLTYVELPMDPGPTGRPRGSMSICRVDDTYYNSWSRLFRSCDQEFWAVYPQDVEGIIRILNGNWDIEVSVEHGWTQSGIARLWAIPVKHIKITPRSGQINVAANRYSTLYETNNALLRAFERYVTQRLPAAA